MAVLSSETQIPNWSLIKDSCLERGGFAPAVRDLYFSQLTNDHLEILDFLSTTACCLMIEAGFLPSHNGSNSLSVEAVQALDYKSRMIHATSKLRGILFDQKHLRRVEFKAIVKKTVQNQDELVAEQFVYSDEPVNVAVIGHENIIVILDCGDFSKSVNLRLEIICPGAVTPHGLETRFTPRGFFTQAKFKPQIFSHILKSDLIFPLVDTIDSACPDVRFDNIPPEVVLNITKYLDVKSFVRLSATSTRCRLLLDNKDGWKLMSKRAKLDFDSYGFRTEMADVITSIAENDEYKAKYIDAFTTAKLEKQQRLRRFFRRYI